MEECAEIYFIEDSLDLIYTKIGSLDYTMDNYRIRFVNTGIHVDFESRKNIERTISDIFEGSPDLKNPVDDFLVTYTGSKWIFGKMLWKTKNRWLIYNKKPYTFCSALPARMSRALVNIAVQHNMELKLLDPCCGMGTVLLQALDMGLSIYGCDINENAVQNANENLIHFGFKGNVECMDASSLKGKYDAAIIDLPYGVLSKRGSDRHGEIIRSIRKTCSRAVILSGGDISGIINDAGFIITESCIVHKGGLDRHISVCE
jgi:tRNA G10  N-methylase Trm11